ncbi:hypothetical protein L3N51_02024 [Metallosphaera sp. J1]|uniref:hypothetical protein n=1 Tax=Metallosphaera javensis (ex Hofmann et al. 2022) TaxID=99938 RepID=UPI001EDCDB2D|nr:hypothetical protein [Metallosphaera javensis (ex Hofmann et al. 2022)]MCG3109728.1 hypothetical protein [Metallosphaera javensis (ex Hofmann et al. 2022)]
MENFLRDPAPEEASKLISSIYSMKSLCIRGPYDPDFVIFSSLISKYFKGEIGVSFSSTCDVTLEKRDTGSFLTVEGKEIYVGFSSFTSLLPLTIDDLVPMLAGISSDLILYRRKPSPWEENLFTKAQDLGVTEEKSLKIPGYREIPLFLSLSYSLDPYIPEISGNRENSLKLVREIGGNEFTKLSELDESQLNTLVFRLITLLVKVNPKVDREELVVKRYFFHGYDFLELGFASIYLLDKLGYPGLFDLALSPSLFGPSLEIYRESLSLGFSLDMIEERNRYLVNTSLASPLLAYVILRQLGKKGKPVFVNDGNRVFTSRFFGNVGEVDSKDKD